ncbi:DHA2 family efflux MFS transporter permease subunit [Lactococcus hircilactis]
MKKPQFLDIHGKPYHRTMMVVLLLVSAFVGMMLQTILAAIIPPLMHDFHIDISTAQQGASLFLLGNGIMIPISAYLATKFSTKWLHFAAYGLLLFGTLVIMIAPTSNYYIFILGRIIEAVAVGLSIPLLQSVFITIFPPEKRGSAMGLVGIAFGLGPAVGPTFAGWVMSANHTFLGFTLTDSWRSIFLIPAVLVGISFVLTPFFIKDVLPNRPMKLDIISFIASIFGFGLFLLGFTNVATGGWGSIKTVILPILAGALIIAYFIWRQFQLKEPLLNLRLFKIHNFSLAATLTALATMAMMCIEMLVPTYLQNVRGLTVLYSSLALLPGALVMGVMQPLAGRAYDRIGGKRLAIVGFGILTIGTFPFMFLTAKTPDIYTMTLYGVRMFGVALIMMSMLAAAMGAAPKNEIAHASAANNTLRTIASSLSVALLTSIAQNVASQNHGNILMGFHASFLLGFILAVAGLVLSFFLQNRRTDA